MIVGLPLDEAAYILNGLCKSVMSGKDRYRAGETTSLPEGKTGELVQVRLDDPSVRLG